MVHAWVDQKVMPIHLIVWQYAYLKVILWYFFLHTMSETATHNHTTQTHNKNHHHGGGAACPSSGMDLMNLHCLRGGGLADIFSKDVVEGFCSN
jgi:hypothetical protein